jgi:hypothetical protein
MPVKTSDSRVEPTQEVTRARKNSAVLTPHSPPADSKPAPAPVPTHWMDPIALWVWVFGIGSMVLINLIDLVKALFVR